MSLSETKIELSALYFCLTYLPTLKSLFNIKENSKNIKVSLWINILEIRNCITENSVMDNKHDKMLKISNVILLVEKTHVKLQKKEIIQGNNTDITVYCLQNVMAYTSNKWLGKSAQIILN